MRGSVAACAATSARFEAGTNRSISVPPCGAMVSGIVVKILLFLRLWALGVGRQGDNSQRLTPNAQRLLMGRYRAERWLLYHARPYPLAGASAGRRPPILEMPLQARLCIAK